MVTYTTRWNSEVGEQEVTTGREKVDGVWESIDSLVARHKDAVTKLQAVFPKV